jgi:hypothetical protein
VTGFWKAADPSSTSYKTFQNSQVRLPLRGSDSSLEAAAAAGAVVGGNINAFVDQAFTETTTVMAKSSSLVTPDPDAAAAAAASTNAGGMKADGTGHDGGIYSESCGEASLQVSERISPSRHTYPSSTLTLPP